MVALLCSERHHGQGDVRFVHDSLAWMRWGDVERVSRDWLQIRSAETRRRLLGVVHGCRYVASSDLDQRP